MTFLSDFGASILWAWTGLGAAWWLIAFFLARRPERPLPAATAPSDWRRLTVFKPLASPIGDLELARLKPCLASFVRELDDNSEMVIGVHESDAFRLRPLVDELRSQYSSAELQLVTHPDPRRFHANPKVSWMQILAPKASGELWLWSDSDMKAPRGLIRSLRADLATEQTRFVTSPYVIQEIGSSPELLDTLYVNLELYPGVVLLDRMNQIRFGFGSGMLFAAEDFRQRVDWDDLGRCLAEDFHLGQRLSPARLGSCRMTTMPASESWTGAFQHYLRWQKTVSWCRPPAYASQLVILPLVGWLAYLPWNPEAALIGLASVLALDTVAALAICHAVGCRIAWRHLPAVPLWSLARGLAWIAAWLPFPVVWRGRKWWSPFQEPETREPFLKAGSEPRADG